MLDIGHKLIHYSHIPLNEIISVEQNSLPFVKPCGLSFSVEDGYGWREFCEEQKFDLDNLTVANELQLASNTCILHLKRPAGAVCA